MTNENETLSKDEQIGQLRKLFIDDNEKEGENKFLAQLRHLSEDYESIITEAIRLGDEDRIVFTKAYVGVIQEYIQQIIDIANGAINSDPKDTSSINLMSQAEIDAKRKIMAFEFFPSCVINLVTEWDLVKTMVDGEEEKRREGMRKELRADMEVLSDVDQRYVKMLTALDGQLYQIRDGGFSATIFNQNYMGNIFDRALSQVKDEMEVQLEKDSNVADK